jgi:hypothetical protein
MSRLYSIGVGPVTTEFCRHPSCLGDQDFDVLAIACEAADLDA